jgi:uncharacterized protein YfiM (DUF2279 family)
MRLLSRLLLLLMIVVALGLTATAILVISDQPTVDRSAEISPENIQHAKRILDKNDPRTLKAGTVRTITINQRDFDLAANYLVHQYGNGSSRVVLSDASIRISASLPLVRNPVGRYVNLDATFRENGALPRFARLTVGRLPVPDRVADWLLHRGLALYLGNEAYQSALDVIKQVRVKGDSLTLTYEWQPNLPDKFRKALLPPEHQERIRLYHSHLTDVTRALAARNVSLAELMVPLFRIAETRSRGGDPIAENRAALLVLTFYVNGKGFTRFIPAAKDWAHPVKRDVTLNGRQDFAQHFTVSAAIAANAGGPLSNAVGLYKEIDDSRAGSGFSFNDIAADRAGTRFGELAAGSMASASKLQQQLSAGVNETDLMPETEDLPEFMPQAEFRQRFGGIDAPEYNRMMAEIERRVAGLRLYK